MGDIFVYLMEERGMRRAEAVTYMENIGGPKVRTVLTGNFMEYLDTRSTSSRTHART